MEHLYTKADDQRIPIKASRETVNFLLDYSKSLSIVSSKGLVFENNLN
ncbi:MAG: hypothetical protein ACO20F_01895 [Robiginitalea sp.]|jgi:hypothetical protein|nr:MAG: hypothetical protein JSW57_06225 [Flavobacteriaceae bacterium]